ncbi:MAG: hypothetical protein D6719_10850 [Candidatus Dadabacteria bacterium]|nr:MAG: hypothetical protein D6719_10850 [Candidatus Dadabacteria bacterium]
MIVRESHNIQKTSNIQDVKSSTQASLAARRKDVLLSMFSDILDKIADQLASQPEYATHIKSPEKKDVSGGKTSVQAASDSSTKTEQLKKPAHSEAADKESGGERIASESDNTEESTEEVSDEKSVEREAQEDSEVTEEASRKATEQVDLKPEQKEEAAVEVATEQVALQDSQQPDSILQAQVGSVPELGEQQAKAATARAEQHELTPDINEDADDPKQPTVPVKQVQTFIENSEVKTQAAEELAVQVSKDIVSVDKVKLRLEELLKNAGLKPEIVKELAEKLTKEDPSLADEMFKFLQEKLGIGSSATGLEKPPAEKPDGGPLIQKQELPDEITRLLENFEEKIKNEPAVLEKVFLTQVAKEVDNKKTDSDKNFIEQIFTQIANDYPAFEDLTKQLENFSKNTPIAAPLILQKMVELLVTNIQKEVEVDAPLAAVRSNFQNMHGGFERQSYNTENSNASTQARAKLSSTQRVKTFERVEQVLKEAAKARNGKTISVRLDPPSLGRVKVDVSLRDGALHARLVAESPQVNQLLRERAHELHAVLRRIGLNVDEVSVSVNSGNSESKGKELFFGDTEREFNRQFSGKAGTNVAHAVSNKPVGSFVKKELDHWVA